MNKSTFAAALAAALCAACTQQPADRFTLNGSVNGLDGEYLYLTYMNDTVEVKDSVKVEGGTFRFEGPLSVPATQGAVMRKLTSRMYDPKRIASFYLEPAELTLTLDTADFSKAHLEGSLTQAQMDSVNAQRAAIMDEAQPILDALQTETDHEKQSELREQLEPYSKRSEKVGLTFVATHPASYAAPDLLRFCMGSMTYDELKKLYDAFTPGVKSTASAKEIGKELETMARVQPGQPAPDFEATDVNGKPFRLSSLKGNYVVIDFWASWCVPCRQSNPHMKELYAKYHDKGLEYVYVADNDSQVDAWHKAIKDDGLEAFHHVLRGLKMDRTSHTYDRTNDISDKYAVHFLPTKYLIDREGRIVGKFESDELEAKLKEIFE